jgi:hypothetical protein
VKIIGWGSTHAERMPYWLIANSWGESWAQKGVFRYVRGANLGGMDAAVWAGCPSGTACELTPAVVTPPAALPRAASRSGGRWHTAAVAPPPAAQGPNVAAKARSHIGDALSAVVRHIEGVSASMPHGGGGGALDARASSALLTALRGGVDADDGVFSSSSSAVACAHTQVVAGLRTRLVLRAGPAHARTHAVATTLLPAASARRRGVAGSGSGSAAAPAHALESLSIVDAAEADALCFGAAAATLTQQLRAGDAFHATADTAAVDAL